MPYRDLVASLGPVQPELILAGAALLCILADRIWKHPDKSLCWLVAALGIVAALASTILSWGTRQTGFYDLVRMDNFANFFSLMFLCSGLLTLFLSDGFVRREKSRPADTTACSSFPCTACFLCPRPTTS